MSGLGSSDAMMTQKMVLFDWSLFFSSYGLRTYSNVFSGEELVTWLTDLGLADDRLAATNYGNTLLRGRVIEHVTKKHSFYDLPYFYRFC